MFVSIKQDYNTQDITYYLYVQNSDFIIEKESYILGVIEREYYRGYSSESISAVWTARASKTYDYDLVESLKNTFNLDTEVNENVSCFSENSVKAGVTINVEDYPLLWIDGNYFDTFKDNTFVADGDGCVFAGDSVDYAAVTEIEIIVTGGITTNITEKFLSRFTNLLIIGLNFNNVTVLDIANSISLQKVFARFNDIDVFDATNLINLNLLDLRANNLSALNTTNLSNLVFLNVRSNQLSNIVNSQILVDLDSHGQIDGYFDSSIFGGGTLTEEGLTAKASLLAKGWEIVGI